MNTEIINELSSAFEELIQLLNGLNEEQQNRVPFEGSWTAAQLGDHLFQSYEVVATLNGNVAETNRPIDHKVADLKELFLNFDIKMESPDFILPYLGIIDKKELMHGLEYRTKAILASAAKNDMSLTCLDFEFPGFGMLSRLEMLTFVLVHTKRHIHQLKNIIAII